MTIRRQIILFVVPLFIGLGAIGSAVSWGLQTEAAQRTRDNASTALAITLSEFIAPADVAHLRAGRPLGETSLGAALPRLAHWALVRRLYLLDPASGEALLDTAEQDGARVAATDLQPDEVRRLPPQRAPGQEWRQLILTFTADQAAVLGIELSAEAFFATKARIRRDALFYGLLASLVGLGVALVIARVLRRQVRRLHQTAETIGSPAFAPVSSGAVVQEIVDLGNTFEVMHSVLSETMDKTHRSLVESGYYRSEGALATTFRRVLQPDASWDGGGVKAAWLTLGSPPPAAFAGALALGPHQGAAFVGITSFTHQLATTVFARAVGAFFADALRRLPLAEAAETAQRLFGCERLVAVSWQGNQLTVWSADPGQDPPPDAASWAADLPVALGCLGPLNRERVMLYLANFPAQAAARLAEALPPFLEPAEGGVVLVLQTSVSLDAGT